MMAKSVRRLRPPRPARRRVVLADGAERALDVANVCLVEDGRGALGLLGCRACVTSLVPWWLS